MAVKLITGLRVTADIESGDDGARIYGTISSSDRVLNVGNLWAYQIISSNLVRIKDGELLMQGRHVRQAPNTYTNLTINNGTQGLKRNDIIVARYTKNSSTGIENVELAVLEGTPSSSTATDPTITIGDIFEGCEVHEMALYRIFLNGLNIESVTSLFTELNSLENHVQSISNGGTGATTATDAILNFKTAISDLIYPVGSIYTSINSTNPSTLFGGTWTSWGTGRVAVGVDISDTSFNMVEKTGGAKTHTLTVTEMPSHDHSFPYRGNTFTSTVSSGVPGAWYADTNVTTGLRGGGSAHNNLQPYITCYMWKRTA